MIALWKELGACVAWGGVKKLLIFNSHGGNVAVMDIVARELRQRHGLLVYSASWFSLPQPPEVQGLFSAQEHRFGIHAGDIETSMMLHLAPGTVHMEHANFRSTPQDRAERFAILGNGKAPRWVGRWRTTTKAALWARPMRLRPTLPGVVPGGGRGLAALLSTRWRRCRWTRCESLGYDSNRR